MSIGLAFVQGLVGGFQKNIEREQTARAADDQDWLGYRTCYFKVLLKQLKRVNLSLNF